MSDSLKPSCSACGDIVDTNPNATDAAQPVSSDSTLCNGCSTESSGCSSASPCEEDHTQEICVVSYSTTVKVLNTFNFPAIGESVSLTLENVTSLLPGAILWNQSIGYLHVQSYDASTGVAIAQNKGDTNVKVPGDLIPDCTEFLVGIASNSTVSGGSGNSSVVPFLAADFTAPADGSCQLASVTNVNGISLNDTVSLNGFQYTVGDIPDAQTLELCNEGEGAPTGQVIEADANCDGIEDVQVVVLSSDDPCSRDGVQTGQIVVCEDGLRRPLVGTVDGQVPVWDANIEKFILVNVNLVEQCTALTVSAIFDIGNTGPYIIVVVSASLFTAGDTIVLTSGTDVVSATIQDVIDGTQLRINLVAAPVAILTFDPPGSVCLQDCCAEFDDLSAQVNTNTANIQANGNIIDGIELELDATIRMACYPEQLGVIDGGTFGETVLDFVPQEVLTVRQRHYDYNNAYQDGVWLDETFGPYGCDAIIEFSAAGTVGMLVLGLAAEIAGAGPTESGVIQVHDIILANDANVAGGQRQIVSAKGGIDFSDIMAGPIAQPPPANFALAGYPVTLTWHPVSWNGVYTLAAGAAINLRLLRRLSISGDIQAINWASIPEANHIEWSAGGTWNIKVWRS